MAIRIISAMVLAIALGACEDQENPVPAQCDQIQGIMQRFVTVHSNSFDGQSIGRIPASHGFPCDMVLRVRGNPAQRGVEIDNEYIHVNLFSDPSIESLEWDEMIASDAEVGQKKAKDLSYAVTTDSIEESPRPGYGKYRSVKRYYKINDGYVLLEVQRGDLRPGRFTPEAVTLAHRIQSEFPPGETR